MHLQLEGLGRRKLRSVAVRGVQGEAARDVKRQRDVDRCKPLRLGHVERELVGELFRALANPVFRRPIRQRAVQHPPHFRDVVDVVPVYACCVWIARCVCAAPQALPAGSRVDPLQVPVSVPCLRRCPHFLRDVRQAAQDRQLLVGCLIQRQRSVLLPLLQRLEEVGPPCSVVLFRADLVEPADTPGVSSRELVLKKQGAATCASGGAAGLTSSSSTCP